MFTLVQFMNVRGKMFNPRVKAFFCLLFSFTLYRRVLNLKKLVEQLVTRLGMLREKLAMGLVTLRKLLVRELKKS
jgi:hypothetical protein